jgi:hypothetical protein
MPGRPTAASEFRRGFDAYNLMVGALAATALGAATLVATATGAAPDIIGRGAPLQALAAALILFATITALHTAAHTYFGWRFSRGIQAAESGDHERALRLLRPVARPGMTHYDPDGHATDALASSRALLRFSGDQPPRRGRSNPARS